MANSINKRIALFEKKVEALRKRMFPKNGDSDGPVEVVIYDNRQFEHNHYDPVPRREVFDEQYSRLSFHPEKQAELDSDRLSCLVSNLDVANHALQTWRKEQQHREYEENRKHLPIEEQIRAACEHCRSGEPFRHWSRTYTEWHSEALLKNHPDYPTSAHESGARCDAFQIRSLQYKLEHGLVTEEKYKYCPKCRARLRPNDSFKGAGNKGTCPNPTCNRFEPIPKRRKH